MRLVFMPPKFISAIFMVVLFASLIFMLFFFVLPAQALILSASCSFPRPEVNNSETGAAEETRHIFTWGTAVAGACIIFTLDALGASVGTRIIITCGLPVAGAARTMITRFCSDCPMISFR